jgi:hypothetical protein
VSKLAKKFISRHRATDRHALEMKIPTNVVPGLHRKLINIQASTEFDEFVA